MDATNGRHWKRRHRHRHRRGPPAPEPPPRSDSETAENAITTLTTEELVPTRESDFVENKMGLPPPYEQTLPNPAPPPSYFGDNPPPPPGLVLPAAPRTTVITSPPSAGAAPSSLGPGPTGTTCASCNRSIVTRVDYVPNNRTHIVSAALCVLTGCCCGCFIPYCMRSCKTANHYCPKCRAFVGTYTPS